MFSKILVAHDGTDLGERALDYGVELAEKYQAQLTVISVIELQTLPVISFSPLGGGIPAYTPNIRESLRKRRKNLLLEDLQEIKKENPSLEVTMKLLEGDPADRIVEMAEEDQFDLIVMGSSGISGLKRVFFGSVSDKVKTESKIPILIVK